MPWNPEEATDFTKKAKSPKQKRQWRDIANSALSRGESDATAIKEANGIIKKQGHLREFHDGMTDKLTK